MKGPTLTPFRHPFFPPHASALSCLSDAQKLELSLVGNKAQQAAMLVIKLQGSFSAMDADMGKKWHVDFAVAIRVGARGHRAVLPSSRVLAGDVPARQWPRQLELELWETPRAPAGKSAKPSDDAARSSGTARGTKPPASWPTSA